MLLYKKLLLMTFGTTLVQYQTHFQFEGGAVLNIRGIRSETIFLANLNPSAVSNKIYTPSLFTTEGHVVQLRSLLI